MALVEWFEQHWVEVFGTVTGLLYIYFSIRQKAILWIIGILTSAAYIYVFFKSKFYADMGLQVYYLVISFYGLYFWLKGGVQVSGEKSEVPVRRTGFKTWIILGLIFLLLWVAMGYFLQHYTDSPVPWADAFTTAASIIATWMLARKLLEQWLIWIVVDLVSMFLYVKKGLYPTAFLFFVYTLLAIVGYIQWLRSMKLQQ